MSGVCVLYAKLFNAFVPTIDVIYNRLTILQLIVVQVLEFAVLFVIASWLIISKEFTWKPNLKWKNNECK